MTMTSAVFKFLFQAVFVFSFFNSAFSCGIPSKLWCSNKETAVRCGVYQQCRVNDWADRREATTPPVHVTLCLESMCPDCRNYIAQQLSPTFENLSSIMNISLIPYGNAQEKKVAPNKWEFDCQHGTEECIGNILETCGLYFVKNFTDYMGWFTCIETAQTLPRRAAPKCAAKYPDIPIAKIEECASSALGNQLEHEMALRTDTECPKHFEVPWVMINGKHSPAAELNLAKVVCETYQGPKPPACQNDLIFSPMLQQ